MATGNIREQDRSLGLAGLSRQPKVVTDTVTLTADETVVAVTVPQSGSKTVNLPPIAQAVGRFFFVYCNVDLGGTGVVVQDQDDAIVSGLNYVTAGNGLTAKGDFVLLFCTPTHYVELKEQTT
jgi:hypothetical protein